MSQSNSVPSGNGADAPATSPTSPDEPLPQARLIRQGEGIIVYPIIPGQADSAGFALCKLPKSLATQLGTACHWFWQRHQRCLAIVLLLEPQQRLWAAAIPAQRCARDSSCWSGFRRELPEDFSSALLMGSFQSRVLASGEDPADCPPPHDGLHIVMSVGSDTPSVHTFLRSEGQTSEIPSSDLFFDDTEPMIQAAMGRLSFV